MEAVSKSRAFGAVGIDEAKVLPPERFSDEYEPPDPAFADEGRGAEADAIKGLLAGCCCGWERRPTAAEFYDAMRAGEPTARQMAIIRVLTAEGSTRQICLAYLQGAFTWRQLARAMTRQGAYKGGLAQYVNRYANRASS